MRKIIHIDADCFFASVELLKRPDLRDFPVAVGGAPDGRGVITTCNYVARAYGVKSAMSSAQARKLCPDLYFFKPNMALYKSFSKSIMNLLAEFSEKVQVVSIDEAYLDVTNSDLYRGSATLIAQAIQRRIYDKIGINVSAGIASSKYLAKIASDWRKPAGVFTITPDAQTTFLATLPLGALPGVGPKTRAKLNRLGLYQCRDVLTCDQVFLAEHLGSFSQRLLEMSLGIDTREVHSERIPKSVSIESTFEQDVDESRVLAARLPPLLDRLADRFGRIKHNLKPSSRVVKVKFSDFTHTTVEERISSFGDVLDAQPFERLTYVARSRRAQAVRLLGVGIKFSADDHLTQLELSLN